MHHGHNSIRIIDSLAEITSHQERHVLEKSLLKTLGELYPGSDAQLFRVKQQDEKVDISLLAYSIGELIVSFDENPRLNRQAEALSQSMHEAVSKVDITVLPTEGSSYFRVLYPEYDALYFAKEQGRDQVRSYQRLVADGDIAPVPANQQTDVELF